MTKYVKVRDDTYKPYDIFTGKVYTVYREYNKGTNAHTYTFKSHYNGEVSFYAQYFVEVSCPCDIRSCLKHRRVT